MSNTIGVLAIVEIKGRETELTESFLSFLG
jgi:hypothetical protein